MALTNTASQSDSLGFHMERWYSVKSNNGTEMEQVVHTHRAVAVGRAGLHLVN